MSGAIVVGQSIAILSYIIDYILELNPSIVKSIEQIIIIVGP